MDNYTERDYIDITGTTAHPKSSLFKVKGGLQRVDLDFKDIKTIECSPVIIGVDVGGESRSEAITLQRRKRTFLEWVTRKPVQWNVVKQ